MNKKTILFKATNTKVFDILSKENIRYMIINSDMSLLEIKGSKEVYNNLLSRALNNLII